MESNTENDDFENSSGLEPESARLEDATDVELGNDQYEHDDGYDYDDEYEDDEYELKERSRSTRKIIQLYCFACNRIERHSRSAGRRWLYSYLLGLTVGLIFLVGPYRCHCCGAKRLMCTNVLNPRYWFQSPIKE